MRTSVELEPSAVAYMRLSRDGWRLEGGYWTRSDGGRIPHTKLLRYAGRAPTNRRRRRRIRRGTDTKVVPWSPFLEKLARASRDAYDRQFNELIMHGDPSPLLGFYSS